ncbi:PIN/TRAM domain-containing protein [Calderihabitans maritimus]|uniref:PilT protein-like protein n=1 Tax=Calderihabitans maritimus TaxID=1246530 RepID=A0A1Z5HNN3_9FIRM|nr:PIN/TRAM domain-containing protein [Calderihabitans maritimus]GAW91139.1 PilT protein-like protein [Calderihabitans maritimus]
MVNRIVRFFIAFILAGAGFSLGVFLANQGNVVIPGAIKGAIIGILTIVFALGGFSLAPRLIQGFDQLSGWLIGKLLKMPIQDIIGGAIGLIVGLIIASLLGSSLSRLHLVGPYISIIVTLFLGYVGLSVGIKKKEELLSIFSSLPRFVSKDKQSKTEFQSMPKILDTSVIIDGRIADICKSGFIEGVLLIPNFVLEELRHIADSPDLLKRNRGRRGLDILNKIRKELDVRVQICEYEFDDVLEVDSRLVKLAKQLGAPIITNDFNLNKVAELQGVKVLNINELANAVKPIVLPGEEMMVHVIKDGKEVGQGVGYLDDGTMIVVENGKKFIGQNIDIVVTSVLQTSAGRMIFGRPKILERKQASG